MENISIKCIFQSILYFLQSLQWIEIFLFLGSIILFIQIFEKCYEMLFIQQST